MLGNDDPPPLARLLDAAPWGEHDEGKVLWIDDDHEIMSWGFSNKTPWNSYREQDEPALAAALAKMGEQLKQPERAIVNVHVPPFDTQLDEAPVLDENFQVQQVLGQVKMAPVGSTAVCDFLTERGPLLGLHGHIHEASGIRRVGRTIAINPGSDYSTGTLNGALVTLEKDKISAHQLVRG
jgi:Icc-related predicted phosphoesterase